MSLQSGYIFGSQQNPSKNLLERMQGDASLKDMPHSISLQAGPGNDNFIQYQQQVLARQQQQMSTVSAFPRHQQQPQHTPTQTKSKKVKDTILKTPLSLLNEVCAKANTAPTFTMEESGPVHMRVYECVVKVDAHGFACEASATGKTKKIAKQEAAKALLVKMDGDVTQYLLPSAAKEESTSPVIEVDPEVPGNPVGNLNDLCTKLKRLPPEYEDVSEIGKPHEKVYTVACKLGSQIVESGCGRSKKSAKKVAAHRVHMRIMDLLTKEDGAKVLKGDDDNLIDKLNSLTLVSKQEAKKINDEWKVTDWLSNLQNRSGPKLDQFKADLPNTVRTLPSDPVKLLKELCEEQKLKLEFLELADNRTSERKTYLIAISTGNQPLTVLSGSAESKTQAKKNAAENFIELWKLVLTSS